MGNSLNLTTSNYLKIDIDIAKIATGDIAIYQICHATLGPLSGTYNLSGLVPSGSHITGRTGKMAKINSLSSEKMWAIC